MRARLAPVLSRAEKFDCDAVKAEVLASLKQFLQFYESEYLFVERFNQREYRPEILFGQDIDPSSIQYHQPVLKNQRTISP